jgi:hypothetical protein
MSDYQRVHDALTEKGFEPDDEGLFSMYGICECIEALVKPSRVSQSGSAGGYVELPSSLTAENGAKGLLIGEFNETVEVTCGRCDGNGCRDCDHSGLQSVIVPVQWTTIKEIYALIVRNYT